MAFVAATPSNAADVTIQLDAGAGFSVKNNTGAIQRLRVEEATGNISRNGALFVHTTGTNNTFVGVSAGNTSQTGFGSNTALGYAALQSNIFGEQNSAFGANALRNNTSIFNSAFGSSALRDNTGGYFNSAFGGGALKTNTTGQSNSALGAGALYSNLTGNFNTAVGGGALLNNTAGDSNTAVGTRALTSNSTGSQNAALGRESLLSNTTGYDNTAVGFVSLASNSTGNKNTAVGQDSLRFNTTGVQSAALGAASLSANTTGGGNSAVGFAALYANTTGGQHTAIGQNALRSNSTGTENSAIGARALYSNTTGNRNAALGKDAGFNQTTGSDNIYLANAGVAAESGKIKIGTVGTHNQATIAGIHNATSSGGIAVLVNANGTLGTTTSSLRFKQNVHDMQAASDVLMKLRPVVFQYREEAVGAEEAKVTQYGLIAEEVAQVAPDLVAPDLEGRPYSVRYHVLPALLLNEVQRQERVIAGLSARLEALEGEAPAACVEGDR